MGRSADITASVMSVTTAKFVRNAHSLCLQSPLQIYHVRRLHPSLVDGVVVVVGKKILDQMMSAKAAGFIKRDGGGAVPGAHLHSYILVRICPDEKLYQDLSIAPALRVRLHGKTIPDPTGKSFSLR